MTNCNDGTRTIIHENKSNFSENSYFDREKNIFFHSIIPKHRLFIIGAVHIAQSLVEIAKNCGYETILIDPRDYFASKKKDFLDAISLMIGQIMLLRSFN